MTLPAIERRSKPRFEDCYFYHSFDLPGHGEVVGEWDLRGGEKDYVGGVDLSGRTVLEFGPASGYLTLYMDREGADVTCIETSPEIGIDILPHYQVDVAHNWRLANQVLNGMTNAWWFVHHEFGLRARVEYGDINKRPVELGKFDIAVIAALLLHCRSPLNVLDQACSVAKEAVIVTELIVTGLETTEDPLLRFNPSGGRESSLYWWQISPGFIANYLRLRGFTDVSFHYHNQRHYPNRDLTQPHLDVAMFTVVGKKPTLRQLTDRD